MTILVVGSEVYTYALEIRAIRVFGTLAPNGFNVSEGGGGGQAIRRMSKPKSPYLKLRRWREFVYEKRVDRPERNVSMTDLRRMLRKG